MSCFRTKNGVSRGVILFSVSLALLVASGADRSWSQTLESSSMDVLLVEVPVHVVDRGGQPVRGLRVDDFKLWDGRKRQKLVGLEIVDLATASGVDPEREVTVAAAAPIPMAARRHFLFLFDLSFARPGAIIQAREAAKELVETALTPTDVAAVATFSLAGGTDLVASFGTDRRATLAAIDAVGLPQPTQAVADPLLLVIRDDAFWLRPGEGLDLGTLKGQRDAARKEHLRDLSVMTQRVARDVERGRVESTISAYVDLAELMEGVDGRKHVVLLSEGFDAGVLIGGETTGQAAESARAVEMGESWRVDSDRRFGTGSSLAVLEQMTDSFRRADCTIHSVDVGGLETGTSVGATKSGLVPEMSNAGGLDLVTGSGQDSLFMMAEQTGGELYRNFNRPGEAMAAMLELTSVTYLLTFQPTELAGAGTYHRLRVEAPGAPRGSRVIARPGWTEPEPYTARSPDERRLEVARLVLDSDDGGPIRGVVFAEPLPASDGGEARVPVLVDLDGGSMIARQSHPVAKFQVYVYAFGAEGQVVDHFTQHLDLERAKVEDRILWGGFALFGWLELPPGQYRVRAVVLDARSGRHGAHTANLAVSAQGDGPVLVDPMVDASTSHWVLVPAYDADTGAPMQYPFTWQGRLLRPLAHGGVAEGRPLSAHLFAFGVGAGDPEVEVRAVPRNGDPIALDVLELARLGTEVGLHLGVGIDTSGLAAGEYDLEISATWDQTTVESTSAIRVVGARPSWDG